MTTTQTAILISSWVLYAIIHSTLASLTVKRLIARKLPFLLPWYRLLFNLVALSLLSLPLTLTFLWRGPPLWQWGMGASILAIAIILTAAILFIWSLRYYDGYEFIGIRQLREKREKVEDQETLKISPLHRFVRHPWYSLGMALIWTREMDMAFLISAVCISLYFIFGSILEERKLMVYHGDTYRAYRERVPGLIPLPWKWLSRQEAALLAHGGNDMPGA